MDVTGSTKQRLVLVRIGGGGEGMDITKTNSRGREGAGRHWVHQTKTGSCEDGGGGRGLDVTGSTKQRLVLMRIGGGGGWISLGPPNKDWGERGEGGGGAVFGALLLLDSGQRIVMYCFLIVV